MIAFLLLLAKAVAPGYTVTLPDNEGYPAVVNGDRVSLWWGEARILRVVDPGPVRDWKTYALPDGIERIYYCDLQNDLALVKRKDGVFEMSLTDSKQVRKAGDLSSFVDASFYSTLTHFDHKVLYLDKGNHRFQYELPKNDTVVDVRLASPEIVICKVAGGILTFGPGSSKDFIEAHSSVQSMLYLVSPGTYIGIFNKGEGTFVGLLSKTGLKEIQMIDPSFGISDNSYFIGDFAYVWTSGKFYALKSPTELVVGSYDRHL
jgi:hypothetical protein